MTTPSCKADKGVDVSPEAVEAVIRRGQEFFNYHGNQDRALAMLHALSLRVRELNGELNEQRRVNVRTNATLIEAHQECDALRAQLTGSQAECEALRRAVSKVASEIMVACAVLTAGDYRLWGKRLQRALAQPIEAGTQENGNETL
jgi:hypothetical protein